MAVPLQPNGMPVWGEAISGPLSAWRAANPAAPVANLEGRADLTDADLAPLAGCLAINLFGCTGVSSACFAHLRGATHLRIRGLTQPTIVAADFAHLAGSLRALYASGCTQLGDAALAPLQGLHTLYISDVQGLSEEAFAPLAPGLRFLEMRRCAAPRTQAGLAHLAGVETLDMEGCSAEAIAAAKAAGLPVTGAPAP